MSLTAKAIFLGKITRPEAPDVVLRRLVQQLGDAARKPIVRLTSPGGSGKTILVSSYLSGGLGRDLSRASLKSVRGRKVSFAIARLLIVLLPQLIFGNSPAWCAEECPGPNFINSAKYSAGNDPHWASPEFDDSNWRPIRIPESPQFAKIIPEYGSGWYRIRFSVPDQLRPELQEIQPALLLDHLGDADEAYLNGVKIGGEGGLGDHFFRADKVVRLYRLPPSLLRATGENLLAVRAANLYPMSTACKGPLAIGDYGELVKRKLTEEFVARNVEFVVFTFFFLWLEFCVFLYLKGINSKEYTSFGIFMLLYSSGYFFDSLTFYETGLKTPAFQAIVIALFSAIPAALLYFQACVTGRKPELWVRLHIYASLLLTAAALLVVRGYEGQRVLVVLWLLVCISSAATALVLAWRAYRQRLNESGPMLVGILWLCVSGGVCLVSQVLGLLPTLTLFGHCQSSLILFVWIIIIKYGLIVRFARIKENMQSLSARLLSAHEEERSRLARELHDGMGQNLVAVKFNLQRINREMNNRLIDGIIEEVSAGINELRDITAGLMPVSLKAMGLANTVSFYAAQYSKKTGMAVSVEADDISRPSPEVELNLFRIFQEALNNAVKHAGAGSVVISLRNSPSGLVMRIRDDGRGFDSQEVQAANRGLGLSIMRERSRLMGGNIHLQTGKDQGTTITVEVPVS